MAAWSRILLEFLHRVEIAVEETPIGGNPISLCKVGGSTNKRNNNDLIITLRLAGREAAKEWTNN